MRGPSWCRAGHPRCAELNAQPSGRPSQRRAALIADLMRDCSRRNGIILDPFGGSGTTILRGRR
ncbi:MAG: DNA methyltransferase [Xanthobacteraceae bacterium]